MTNNRIEIQARWLSQLKVLIEACDLQQAEYFLHILIAELDLQRCEYSIFPPKSVIHLFQFFEAKLAAEFGIKFDRQRLDMLKE